MTISPPLLLPVLPTPGFRWAGFNAGIKDQSLDFAVAVADQPCSAAAVFTRNHFPGAPIVVGREHIAGGTLQAVVVNSKNANVATGDSGINASRRICELSAERLGIEASRVLPSSTGVIGVPLPMPCIEAACQRIPAELGAQAADLNRFAEAILTTDTGIKAQSVKVDGITLTGVAKGSGMIAPNMATMLVYFFTDADLPSTTLQPMLQRITARTFNCISVDSDMSTSDTVVILAGGLAGVPTSEDKFEAALNALAEYLAKAIARDGEGATKLIELEVCEAPSSAAAEAIARSIINSPLVKTAVHGADPNWGRFVMAIGKVLEHPIPIEGIRLCFGKGDRGIEIDLSEKSRMHIAAETLKKASNHLKQSEVLIRVMLGAGHHSITMWGCDLSADYVRINADYTT